jgi:YD repeat-containing protein
MIRFTTNQITDPLGLVTTLAYRQSTGNLVSSVADAGVFPHLNATSRFTYDRFVRVLTTTDPKGVVNSYNYDAFENVVTQVADIGNGHLNATTRLGYDALGNLISRTDPNSNTVLMTYDVDRRLLTMTAPAPFNTGPSSVLTSSTYGADGHIISVTKTNGGNPAMTQASYTATGQVQTVTDPNGITLTVHSTAYVASRLGSALARLRPACGPRFSAGAKAIVAERLRRDAVLAGQVRACLTSANPGPARRGTPAQNWATHNATPPQDSLHP